MSRRSDTVDSLHNRHWDAPLLIEIGEAKGADPAPIILAHSSRIVMTIALIASWFRIVQGTSVGRSFVGSPLAMSGTDAALYRPSENLLMLQSSL